MVKSAALDVPAYLASLPPERQAVMRPLRDLIVRHLPAGYVESMNWGMIAYEIPLARYGPTYNGQPLGYVALAAQKNGYSLYLTSTSMRPEREQALREAFGLAGKKLDMGKSCVRFARLEDLPLEAIAASIAGVPVETYLAEYEAARAAAGTRPASRSARPRSPTQTAARRSSTAGDAGTSPAGVERGARQRN